MDEPRTWQPLSCLADNYDGNIVLIKLNTPFSGTADIQLFGRLWKYAVLRACTDGGANILHDCAQLNHGSFLPHFISGDFDSIRPDVREFYMGKKCEIIATPDQNETDFTKCLRITLQKLNENDLKCDRIVVHVSTTGRMDHIMANINTLYLANQLSAIPVYLLTSSSLSCLLPPGKHLIDVDSTVRGSWCSLVPVGCPCRHVTTSGMVYNLNDDCMSFGDIISTSNAFSDSPVVAVETDQPLLWSMGLKLQV